MIIQFSRQALYCAAMLACAGGAAFGVGAALAEPQSASNAPREAKRAVPCIPGAVLKRGELQPGCKKPNDTVNPGPTADVQGARDHRSTTPPAPAPTVDRDQRTTLTPLPTIISPDEPRQWMIREAGTVNAGQEYAIINLRRQFLDRSSRLTFKEMPSGLADTTGWGDNGGNWIFTRSNMSASGPLKDTDVVALYNTKTRRYLSMGRPHYAIWKETPQYVWMVKHVRQAPDGVRFALFSIQQRRFAAVCDGSLDEYGAYDGDLCAHQTPIGWLP